MTNECTIYHHQVMLPEVKLIWLLQNIHYNNDDKLLWVRVYNH